MSNSDMDALFESEDKSYMHFDSPEQIMEYRKQKFPDRIDHYNFSSIQIPFLPYKIKSLIIKCLNRLAKMHKRKPITDIYSGWQWLSWHRSVAEYVLKFVKENPAFFKRFRLSYCSDEIFFHTILHNQAEKLNIEKYNSLRFIEWYPKRKAETLPLVLDEREYDDMIHSGAIFCRKVHPVLSAKLIALLKKLHNK
jgi:hypothetical protein